MIAFKDWAFDTWRLKYGSPPPWLPKDFVLLASALKALGSPEAAQTAWLAFMASTDPFYAGHEPGKFLSSLGRWVPKAKSRPAKPRDAEAVRARVRIMREVYADPKFSTEQERRDEYARRAREL